MGHCPRGPDDLPQDLQRVAYVFAETAGRPPADVVVDVLADRTKPLPASR